MRCLRQLLRRAHPNGGTPELARTACGAVSRQVRKQMLSCFVLIVRIRIMRRMRQLLRRAIPEWESGGNWKSGTHRRKLFCQKANARVGFCGRLASPHPIAGRRSPSAPHTMPTVALPVGKCSAVLCLPRPLFLPAVRFMNGGAIEFTSQGSFLSGNACWHKLCGPIVGTAEPASFAHDADSRFASRQMLSRILPAARIFFPRYPIYISQ